MRKRRKAVNAISASRPLKEKGREGLGNSIREVTKGSPNKSNK